MKIPECPPSLSDILAGLKNPSHRSSHGISYQTARTDLLDLAQKRLLIQTKRRKTFLFRVPADIADRLAVLP